MINMAGTYKQCAEVAVEFRMQILFVENIEKFGVVPCRTGKRAIGAGSCSWPP